MDLRQLFFSLYQQNEDIIDFTKLLDKYIKQGGNLEEIHHGETLLTLATEINKIECLKLLLSRKAKVDARCSADRTALVHAVDQKNIDAVICLIQYKADVNIRGLFQETVLHKAAEKGLLSIASLLVKAGSDKNAQDDIGMTPLMKAVSANQITMVKWLLQESVEIERVNKYLKTALYIACEKNYLLMINMLIEAGANIECKNAQKMTPLMQACEKGYDEMVQFLLAKNAQVNRKGPQLQTPLHFAVQGQSIGIIHQLIDHNARVNEKDIFLKTPLFYAAIKLNSSLIEQLVQRGADLSSVIYISQSLSFSDQFILFKFFETLGRFIPLRNSTYNQRMNACNIKKSHDAAWVGQSIGSLTFPDTLCFLINDYLWMDDYLRVKFREGFNKIRKIKNYTLPSWVLRAMTLKRAFACLHQKRFEDFDHILEAYKRQGGQLDICFQGNTLLVKACSLGENHIIETLIKAKANLNKLGYRKKTALIEAIDYGHTKVAESLIQAGADIHKSDDVGETALHKAARNGNLQGVLILLEQGAFIDSKNIFSQTSLHLAVLKNHLNIVKILLKKGASSIPDIELRTPLSYAIFNFNKEAVECLVQNKADITLALKAIKSLFKCDQAKVYDFLESIGCSMPVPSFDNPNVTKVVLYNYQMRLCIQKISEEIHYCLPAALKAHHIIKKYLWIDPVLHAVFDEPLEEAQLNSHRIRQ